MSSRRALLAPLALAVALSAGTSAGAPNAPTPPEPADVTSAREAFVAGARLAKDAQWGEALAAFERSEKLHPHAATTYNIGACYRAMGRYTMARRWFAQALSENGAAGGSQLADGVATEIHAYVDEMDRVVATYEVTLDPPDADIAVDGRALEGRASSATPSPATPPVYVAGTMPPGPGQPLEGLTKGKFRLVVDPGTHVVVVSRKGFSDVVERLVAAPGSVTSLSLELATLPASLHIASDREHAVVAVNDMDVGIAPVTLSRPAGAYHVLVREKGFVTYETDALLHPGERVDLLAQLKPEKPALTQRWWFWTAAGVVVAGAAVGTYFATRPAPERPALNGGGLGWTVKTP
jgi:hypothetical protein